METNQPQTFLFRIFSISRPFLSLFLSYSILFHFPGHHSKYKASSSSLSIFITTSSSNPMPRERNCCASCCSTIFTLGLVVLFYWLIFQPHQIRAYVDTATLSSFALNDTASGHSLTYNLNMTLSLRNPNRRIGIYYDRLNAAANYNGAQLGPTETNFALFFQHTKTTNVVYPAFAGTQDNLSDGVRDEFNKEKAAGVYNVEVKLNAKLRYKLWFVKIHGFKPKIDCWLSFPVMSGGGASTAPFTKCHVKY